MNYFESWKYFLKQKFDEAKAGFKSIIEDEEIEMLNIKFNSH